MAFDRNASFVSGWQESLEGPVSSFFNQGPVQESFNEARSSWAPTKQSSNSMSSTPKEGQ